MVRLIPARIENGRVIPSEPLPEGAEVRSVTVLVEVVEPELTARESTLPRLLGILKTDVPNPREQYRQHLEEKYR